MRVTSRLVLVGAVGWNHPEWRGSFYPDDLPGDWLLPYYNTHFQAVFLPALAWQSASSQEWAHWLDDTREDFVFVLEAGDPAVAAPAAPRIVLATPAWSSRHVWWLEEDGDLRTLAQRITRHAETGEPLFVFSRSGSLSGLQQVMDLAQVMGY